MADWEEDMSVGVEAVDASHRQLWRRIRHLASAVGDGEAGAVRSSLRLLHATLVEQHAEEERWMEEAGYPGAREHERAHAALRGRLAALGGEAGAGVERRLLAAVEAVAREVEEHMRTDDLKLGRFWTARENLRRLAEAGPGIGAALTPIPGRLAAVRPSPRRDDDGPAPAPPAPSEP